MKPDLKTLAKNYIETIQECELLERQIRTLTSQKENLQSSLQRIEKDLAHSVGSRQRVKIIPVGHMAVTVQWYPSDEDAGYKERVNIDMVEMVT